jgi:hypothetical protein
MVAIHDRAKFHVVPVATRPTAMHKPSRRVFACAGVWPGVGFDDADDVVVTPERERELVTSNENHL